MFYFEGDAKTLIVRGPAGCKKGQNTRVAVGSEPSPGAAKPHPQLAHSARQPGAKAAGDQGAKERWL